MYRNLATIFILTSSLGGTIMNDNDPSAATDGPQAFLAAVSAGQTEHVAELLATDTALADATDNRGTTALLLALYHKHDAVAAQIRAARQHMSVFEAAALGDVPALRDHYRADERCFEEYSTDGFSPLHLASFFGNTSAMRFILANGGDVEAVAKNPSKVRPLHSAAATRKANVVRVILAAGADADSQQMGGHTAMHSAVMHDNLAMTTVLLSNGADVDVKNEEGQSAIDLAEKHDARQCLSMLRAIPRIISDSETPNVDG